MIETTMSGSPQKHGIAGEQGEHANADQQIDHVRHGPLQRLASDATGIQLQKTPLATLTRVNAANAVIQPEERARPCAGQASAFDRDRGQGA
jgi:hypothetical protein